MEHARPPHRLCVAPMMERTDRHCRYLLRLIAPHAWLYTEMITAAALLRGDADGLLRFDASEHPVALQLGGSEPRQLAAAAKLGEAAGYDEINLNVGCPSGRVQAGRFGAALMLEPALVADCVAAMREAVDIPVTVKHRLGVDDRDDDACLRAFVDCVAAAGTRSLFVHARKAWLSGLSPKENREVPPLQYERVYRLKADLPELEIVINGGIDRCRLALEQLDFVDGVMLGRAAYRDPMLLGEIDAAMFGGVGAERSSAIEAYLAYMQRELENGTPLKAMTRHLMGIYAARPGGRHWRRMLAGLPEGRQGLQAIRQFSPMPDRPRFIERNSRYNVAGIE